MAKPETTLPLFLSVDGRNVTIKVSDALMAHFHEQFKTNTEDQRKRKATLQELMRAAYCKGLRDGRSN